MQVFKHDGKEYIELPKTKDGEYIHFGDTYYEESGKPFMADEMELAIDEFILVCYRYGYKKRIHNFDLYAANPQPEVLDADGVPIKVGDVVYHNLLGTAETVVELFDDGGIRVESSAARLHGSSYTHREPDTQEKIDADAELNQCFYYKKYLGGCPHPEINCNECGALVHKHLLNRQREYDKRERGGE